MIALGSGTTKAVIEGTVTDANRRPVDKCLVTVFARSFKSKHVELGSGQTDADGFYSIEYARQEASANIFVRADRTDGVSIDSPTILGPTIGERLDLVVDTGPVHPLSSFQVLESRVIPHLAREGLAPADLPDFDDEDLGYLAATSGVELAEVALLQRCLALANETGLHAEFFFGFCKQGAPANLSSILALAPAERERAVEDSYEAGEISHATYEMRSTALLHLNEIALNRALAVHPSPEMATLGRLLERVAGMKSTDARDLAQMYRQEPDVDRFWSIASARFGKATTDRVQFSLRLSALSQNHLPLLEQLATNGQMNPQRVASLDRSGWLDTLKNVGLPPSLQQAGFTREDYAELLYSSIEEAFPTDVIREQAHRLPRPDLTRTFWANNPTFELDRTSLLVYLRENPNAIGGPNPQETRRVLLGIERTFRIAPKGRRLDVMAVLLSEQVDSAERIRSMGRSAFVRQFGHRLGEDVAGAVFSRAAQATALSTLLYLRHGAPFNRGSTPTPVPGVAALSKVGTGPSIPDWESLFGSSDFCSCTDCQSLLSPAAYLFDLFEWLENRHAPSGDALAQLSSRRPDLTGLELSCKNTHTQLPYIDLINEALENGVAPPTESSSYQTTGTQADLAIEPENINERAYEILCDKDTPGTSIYPFSLPFDLGVEEARSYLGAIGQSRSALMETFRTNCRMRTLNDLEIATEKLGMSPFEREVIQGIGEDPNVYWNIKANEFPSTLSQVDEFLDRASVDRKEPLAFEELTNLLRSTFIQAESAASAISFPNETCSVGSATITDLTSDRLRRVDQLLRLRHRLGWTLHELDVAIQVLGEPTKDSLFTNLANVKRLQALLPMDRLRLLSFWGPIDTRRWSTRLVRKPDPAGTGFALTFCTGELTPRPAVGEESSLYDRIFQAPSMLDSGSTAFGLNADGTELQGAADRKEILPHIPALAGALGVSEDELLLLAAHRLGHSGASPALLNLANVSSLFRHVTLARGLKVTVADLLTYIDLTGIDPFHKGPITTLLFVEQVKQLQAGPFSVPELRYLLRDEDTNPPTFRLGKQDVGMALLELRSALSAAGAAYPKPGNFLDLQRPQLQEACHRSLVEFLDENLALRAMEIVDRDLDKVVDEPASEQFLREHFSLLTGKNENLLVESLLTGPGLIQRAEDRLRLVLVLLQRWLRQNALERAAVQFLSVKFSIEPSVTEPLLKRYLAVPTSKGRVPAIRVAVDERLLEWSPSNASDLPDPRHFQDQASLFLQLSRLSLPLLRWKVKEDELQWLLVDGPERGVLDLANLPVHPATAAFSAWSRLARAFDLRDQYFHGELFDLLSAAALDDAPADLAETIATRAGWKLDDFEHLCTLFSAEPPGSFADEHLLYRLAPAMEMISALGIRPETAWDWSRVPEAFHDRRDQARQIKRAARAKIGEEGWGAIARPVRDRLRELQRDALGAWLVAHQDFRGFDDLYDHYLLDVETSSCAMTSRLRQALSSVQLFVHRALLNLEPGFHLTLEESEEWKALNRYRIWEANRKVLFYPENWIDPELRDDKSPFFEDLEAELLQAEIDDESIDRALSNYLARLSDVARVEVVGYEVERPESPLLLEFDVTPQIEHVIARTQSSPRKYFYRRRINGARWTPWESIPLDIVGDQVLPAVFDGKLYLFWLHAQHKTKEPPGGTRMPSSDSMTTGFASPKGVDYLDVRLEWSRYRHGTWEPKRVSDEVVTTESLPAWWNDPFDSKQPLEERLSLLASETGSPIAPELALAVLLQHPVMPDTIHVASFVLHGSGSISARTPIEMPNDDSLATAGRIRAQSFTGNQRFVLQVYDPPRGVWKNAGWALQQTPGRFHFGPITSFRGPPSRGFARFFFVDPFHGFLVESPLLEPQRAVVSRGMAPQLDLAAAAVTEKYPFYAVGPQKKPSTIRQDLIVENKALVGGRVDMASATIDQAIRQLGAQPDFVLGDSRPLQLPQALHASVSIAGAPSIRGSVAGAHSTRALATTSKAAAQQYVSGGLVQSDDTNSILISVKKFDWESIDVDLPSNQIGLMATATELNVRFRSFAHPFADRFAEVVHRFGSRGLLDPPSGPWLRQAHEEDIEDLYQPAKHISLPRLRVEFTGRDAYSLYNWEIFFHLPFLIATRLTSQRRFAEAQEWFHCIFDPTEPAGGPGELATYWKFRPFFEHASPDDIGKETAELRALLYGEDPESLQKGLAAQVQEWRSNPFNPHAIARLRHSAYMKAVVMRYIDNLIEWGDDLFRQDTIESINEATLLYSLAARLLGPRPEEVAVPSSPPATYDVLRGRTQVELPPSSAMDAQLLVNPGIPLDVIPTLPGIFCIPPNQKLVTDYWDRVADRLFKVRNCLNIDGVFRQLALFDPPIDPGLLVRARAAGLDLGSVLRDANAPLPMFRFQPLQQRAQEFVSDVISLGSGLLSAIEKKDSEGLALLRAGHQSQVQRAALQVLEIRVEEAKESLEGLKSSRKTIEFRQGFYENRHPRIRQEIRQEKALKDAQIASQAGDGLSFVLALWGALPDVTWGGNGVFGTPVAKLTWGAQHAKSATEAALVSSRMSASYWSYVGTTSGIAASHDRRQEEWDFQADMAARELEGMDSQILAAEIRLAIAEKEVENFKLQMKNQEEEEAYLRTKYSNFDLYGWMMGQTSSIYYQAYGLAYEMAKRAERAWQFELADPSKSFIQFGHWDGQKKGLLAGERLRFDLRRMDAAYVDHQKREHELTAWFSLRNFDGNALEELRRTGTCDIALTEGLLDLDSPGHYLRRIKSVALSLPSVTGPHTAVRCTLTLLKSKVRINASLSEGYASTGDEDHRFRADNLGIRSIVTSRGESDTGTFDPSGGDKYSPFEGAGAISEWRLELPGRFPNFDYNTISDAFSRSATPHGMGERCFERQPRTTSRRLWAKGPSAS